MGGLDTTTIHRIRGPRFGWETDNPKFRKWLPGYFFIFVKVIQNDHWSRYEILLILLANRFNSAYYLLRNARGMVRW
jgi:hypothetical protein